MTRTLRHVFEEVCHGSAETALRDADIRGWWSRVVRWPPDVFAVTSTLLSDSGAYTLIVSPPEGNFSPIQNRDDWLQGIGFVSDRWRAWLSDTLEAAPSELQDMGEELAAYADVAVASLNERRHDRLVFLLLELHAMADAVSAWLGIPDRDPIPEAGEGFSSMRLSAELRLAVHGTLASFPPDKLRVLPKLRTPQLGVSLRSLSFHLATVRSEVRVDWSVFPGGGHQLAGTADGGRFNVLLFPWPFEIAAAAFQEQVAPPWRPVGDFGAFEYNPLKSASTSVAAELDAALSAAKSKHVRVDAVVLPEAAIDDGEFWEIAAVLEKHAICFFLAGVRGRSLDDGRYPTNVAKLGLLFQGDSQGWHVYEQPKHHRWCLDGAQVYQYHLGATLDPRRVYWENIHVPRRNLHFVALNSWLTLSHLICEDLARIDPVSEVVRAVGPNLLIALLLDGPQLEQRWPARYASVFADDPGTSVLTLTSLGMVRRSKVREHRPSRVVGLWKDRVRGAHELALEEGSHALVLTLCAGFAKEFAADGRDDGTAAGQIVLGGVEQVAWRSPFEAGQMRSGRPSPIASRALTVLCIVTDALALSPGAHKRIIGLAQSLLPEGLSPALDCLGAAFENELARRQGRTNHAVLLAVREALSRSTETGSSDAYRALSWTFHGRLRTLNPPPRSDMGCDS